MLCMENRLFRDEALHLYFYAIIYGNGLVTILCLDVSRSYHPTLL